MRVKDNREKVNHEKRKDIKPLLKISLLNLLASDHIEHEVVQRVHVRALQCSQDVVYSCIIRDTT
jgi:hypothetical protein